jgi:hypothetical protein
MRFAPGLLAVFILVARAVPALAACGDNPGDAAALAATQAHVEATCPCAAATSHQEYVRCAALALRTMVGNNTLPPECLKTAWRCAKRSTCGRPGAVTCCRVAASGRVRCAIKREASRCTGDRCVGTHPSCCDACGPIGCNPPPTTTTTTVPPCGGGPFSCGGACPAGLTCAPVSDFEPYCGCVPDGSQPCGDATQPFCNGTCPPGEECGPAAIFEGAPCFCHPVGATPCGEVGYPTCGGICPDDDVCQAFRAGTIRLCSCADPAVQCSTGCGVQGVCPPGEACTVNEGPCGCGAP